MDYKIKVYKVYIFSVFVLLMFFDLSFGQNIQDLSLYKTVSELKVFNGQKIVRLISSKENKLVVIYSKDNSLEKIMPLKFDKETKVNEIESLKFRDYKLIKISSEDSKWKAGYFWDIKRNTYFFESINKKNFKLYRSKNLKQNSEIASFIRKHINESRCEDLLEIPNINSMTYHDARKALIKAGFRPRTRPYDPDVVNHGNGPEFWKKGYHEVEGCSGTGYGFCRFEFIDPYSNTLVVITSGEEVPEEKRFAGVDKFMIETEGKRINDYKKCKRVLSIPFIKGETYNDARKELIKAGWQTYSRHWSYGKSKEVKAGNGPVFWERWYHELVTSSGKGEMICRFEFIDPFSNILTVITKGEETKDKSKQALVKDYQVKVD